MYIFISTKYSSENQTPGAEHVKETEKDLSDCVCRSKVRENSRELITTRNAGLDFFGTEDLPFYLGSYPPQVPCVPYIASRRRLGIEMEVLQNFELRRRTAGISWYEGEGGGLVGDSKLLSVSSRRPRAAPF